MGKYERMMAIEVEPDDVFRYISDPAHSRLFTHLGGKSDGDPPVRIDTEGQRVEWDVEGDDPRHGAAWVRPGDITPELTEVTIELDFPNRPEDDPRGEGVLDSMRQALEEIRQHVR